MLLLIYKLLYKLTFDYLFTFFRDKQWVYYVTSNNITKLFDVLYGKLSKRIYMN